MFSLLLSFALTFAFSGALLCTPNAAGTGVGATPSWCNAQCNAAGFALGSTPNCVAYCSCNPQDLGQCFVVPPYDQGTGITVAYCQSVCQRGYCPQNVCSPGCASRCNFIQIPLAPRTLTSPTLLSIVSTTDDATELLSFGFNFPYDGNSYSQAIISSNGFINFNTADTNSYCCDAAPLPSLSPPNEYIAFFFTDLDGGPTSDGGGIVQYQVLGSAPTRELVIEYIGMGHNDNRGQNFNGQLVLRENGQIEMHYISFNAVVNDDSYSAGAENGDGSRAASIFSRIDHTQISEFENTAWSANCAARF